MSKDHEQDFKILVDQEVKDYITPKKEGAPQTIPNTLDVSSSKYDNLRYQASLESMATTELGRSKTSKNTSLDPITGEGTLQRDRARIFITNYEKLTSELGRGTANLMDMASIELAKINNYTGSITTDTVKYTVEIDLEEYMHLRGWKVTSNNKRKRKTEVKDDLDLLFETSIEWDEKRRGKSEHQGRMRLISGYNISRRGLITIEFVPTFASYLANSYIYKFPQDLMKIDNPTAYQLGKKLASYYSMNNHQNKKIDSEGFMSISITALLTYLEDYIPSYERVNAENRQVTARIIDPFDKALEELETSDIIQFEYCNAKKAPLTEDQLKDIDYQKFSKLYIKFKMTEYPKEN
ncbi:RepB family plasmid replication initiator protein [Aerococcus suis]